MAMASEIQTRREEEKELRRQTILDAAEQLIATRSWEDVNYGEIAKLTRLSRTLIYVYFPTRDALFDAVRGRGALVLEQAFVEAIASAETGLEQVEAIGRAYHAFSRDYPVYFKLHAEQEAREQDVPPGGVRQDYSHPIFKLLAQAFACGVADGSISRKFENFKLSAIALWTFTHGLLLIAMRKENVLQQMDIESQKLVDHGFDMLRHMLAAETPRAPAS